MVKTKDEIIAQKSKSIQLSFEETNKDKSKSNPKIVYYSLFAIICLSSFFWLYSEAKNSFFPKNNITNLRLPQIKLPQISSNSLDLDKFISKSIDLDNGFWSFYINTSNFDYQKNADQFNIPLSVLKDSISNLPQSTSNYFSKNLPQALNIKENLTQENDLFLLELLIELPSNKQIFIFVKNVQASDLTLAKSQLQNFIPNLYWRLISLD